MALEGRKILLSNPVKKNTTAVHWKKLIRPKLGLFSCEKGKVQLWTHPPQESMSREAGDLLSQNPVQSRSDHCASNGGYFYITMAKFDLSAAPRGGREWRGCAEGRRRSPLPNIIEEFLRSSSVERLWRNIDLLIVVGRPSTPSLEWVLEGAVWRR